MSGTSGNQLESGRCDSPPALTSQPIRAARSAEFHSA